MKIILTLLCAVLINMPTFAAGRRMETPNKSARGTITHTTQTKTAVAQQQIQTIVPETTQTATVIDNEAEYLQKKALYEQLQQQADEIAKNKQECDKAKKGWLAGTIIGSAGVIGTTIGAIVQGNKIQEAKTEVSEKTNTLNELDEQINALKNGNANE